MIPSSFLFQSQSPDPCGTLELAKTKLTLDYKEDEKCPEKIILKIGGENSNEKHWFILSGPNLSSSKIDSEFNRWVKNLTPMPTLTVTGQHHFIGLSGYRRFVGTSPGLRRSPNWPWMPGQLSLNVAGSSTTVSKHGVSLMIFLFASMKRPRFGALLNLYSRLH